MALNHADLLFLNIFLYSVEGTHKLFWTVYHQKDFRNKFRPYCASIYIISFSFFAFHIFHIMYFIAVHAWTKSLKVLWLFICHFSRPFVYKRFEDKKNIDFTTNYEAAYMFVGTWKSIHKTNENFSFSLRSMFIWLLLTITLSELNIIFIEIKNSIQRFNVFWANSVDYNFRCNIVLS